MIIETKRAAFNPIEVDLTTLVGAGVTLNGEALDFDFKNQFKETNETLEVFVTTEATSAGAAKLQVVVDTKDSDGEYERTVSGEVFTISASTTLVANKVLAKIVLPDDTKQIVRVSLVNAGAAFTAGKVVGLIRPL